VKKIIEIKNCHECPFHADTYIISYKEVDDGSTYCTFYEERIGGERGDESMFFDERGELFELGKEKDFPNFCQVRKITLEGDEHESKNQRPEA